MNITQSQRIFIPAPQRGTPHTAETARAITPQDVLRHICEAAHLAPSTHNTQPWQFDIDDGANSIDIYLDRTYILSASDPHGKQAMISIGACIANIEIAAQTLGFTTSIQYEPLTKEMTAANASGERYRHVAHIHMQPAAQRREHTLYPYVWTRRVHRAEYDEHTPVPTTLIDLLGSLTQQEACLSFHLVSEKQQRRILAELQSQADAYVLNSREFSRELGDWVLPNDAPTGRGIPGHGFGLQDAEAHRLHRGFLGEIPLQPEDTLKFSLAAKQALEKSSGVCLIAGTKDTPATWIATGRILEYMLLTLEQHGVSASIHAGIIEVPLIHRMCQLSFDITDPLMTLFRIGYVKDKKDYARPHSPRAILSDVIRKK